MALWAGCIYIYPDGCDVSVLGVLLTLMKALYILSSVR